MSLKSEAIKRFLTAAKSLADQGLSKEAIIQFAKNEFGQINELFQRQIDNIFKPKQGIENIKIKDEVFDDTVIKLPVDDTGQPFNPRNPMKEYGKPKISIEERMDTIKETSKKLDDIMKERKETFKPKKTDDFNLSEDDPLGDLEKIIRGEGDTGLPKKPKKPRDEKYTGGLVDVEPSLSDIGHGSDALMARTRLISPGAQGTTSTGLNYLLAEDNDNIRIPFENGKNFEMYLREREQIERQRRLEQLMKEYQDDINRKKVMEQKQMAAEGGRIGFANGNGVADEDAEKAALGKRVRELMDDGFDFGEAVKQAMSEGYAEGGRIGFSKGKLADAARRKFMKIAGGIGAGITGLKTGLLGLGKEAAPVVEKTVETVTETAQNVPPYFLNLVNKIKNLGTKFKGPTERSESYRFKDYEMDVELDTGKIDIKKTKEAMIPGGDEAGIAEEVYMTYKPGMADETTKGKKVVDEYEEFTARPDAEGKMKDVDGGVPDEVIEEGTIFEDNIKDFGKADGGPITATEIPLKPAVKDINKKGQPYTTMYSLGGIARLLGE